MPFDNIFKIHIYEYIKNEHVIDGNLSVYRNNRFYA